ncbi:EAL domain-containing protein [bacterium]|nr:EAL domain-containing protein [bacterium]
MPLSELLAYFNDRSGGGADVSTRLRVDAQGAHGRYGELRLESVFQPLFRLDSLEPFAYEALLRVRDDSNLPVSPQQAFEQPKTTDEILYFDRLCRSVHAVNFARQAGEESVLFLNVDGRHLLGVEGRNHGSTFEKLLQHCGLKPRQVVLEIIESGIDDLERLLDAVAAYQARGYRVAIDDFGCQHSNFDRLWQLTPDIVKLDRSLILQSEINPRARLILPKLVDIIHDLDALVVCEGIETAAQHAFAREAGVDLVQGFLYARPAPQLLARRPEAATARLIRRADKHLAISSFPAA